MNLLPTTRRETGMLRRLGLIPILLSGCIAGCTSISTIDVEGDDGPVMFGAARAAKSFGPRWSMEFESNYGRGSDSQVIGTGEFIVLRDTIFPEGDVESTFTQSVTSISARSRMQSDAVTIDFLLGFTLINANLELNSATQQADNTSVRFGPHIGGRVSWQGPMRIGLYGQILTSRAISYTVSTLTAIEIGLTARLSDSVSLFAGGHFTHYEHDRDFISDIEFDLGGPVIGLAVEF